MHQSPAPAAPRRGPAPRRRRDLASLFALCLLALAAMPAAAGEGTWRSITPQGAAIRSVAASPGRSGVVYAVTARGEVYGSEDGAASWSLRSSLPQVEILPDLAVDPVRPEVVYARSSRGLVRSADGGRSWSVVLAGGVQPVGPYAVARSDNRILYAARGGELLRSADGGATWRVVSRDHSFLTAVDPVDPDVVYAASEAGMGRSDDGGVTWTYIGGDLEDEEGKDGITNLVVDSSGRIYADASFARFVASSDRGATWQDLWQGPEEGGEPISFPARLAVAPQGGAVYATYFTSQGEQIYRSTDSGASWSLALPAPATHRQEPLGSLAVDAGPDGKLYAGSPSYGVLTGVPGGFWTVASNGIEDLSFLAVAADPNVPGRLFALATGVPGVGPLLSRHFLLRSTDGGATWSAPPGPGGVAYVSDLAADPAHPGTWYLATSGRFPSGILKTSDGGDTWEAVNRGLRPGEHALAVEVAPSRPDALYALGWGRTPFPECPDRLDCPRPVVFRTVDGGAQWRRARIPAQPPGSLPGSLAVDAGDAATVYAFGTGIWKSTDGGVSWRKLAPRGLRGTVVDLLADPVTPGKLYAAISVPHGRRVFRSLDGGETWRRSAGGLPAGLAVRDLDADPAVPGTLYAATARGVYVTRDGGGLWSPLGEGLGAVSVNAVAGDPARPGVVYAAGSDGLYELAPEGAP